MRLSFQHKISREGPAIHIPDTNCIVLLNKQNLLHAALLLLITHTNLKVFLENKKNLHLTGAGVFIGHPTGEEVHAALELG